MATPAQITANRANALHSTGPRTDAGKSATRFNALQHGLDAQSAIIPGEDPAEYDALAAGYRDEFRPATPSETFHVDTMIRADWSKRRLQPMETELYSTLMTENPDTTLVAAILGASPAAKLLARIQRQIVAFERAWYRAYDQLRRARLDSQADEQQAFEAFVDRACAIPKAPELASFPKSSVGVSAYTDFGPQAEQSSPDQPFRLDPDLRR
jgi:hypothetical protein